MKLKTAILQMRSENREYQKNTDIVIEKMAEASENGADILLLPEPAARSLADGGTLVSGRAFCSLPLCLPGCKCAGILAGLHGRERFHRNARHAARYDRNEQQRPPDIREVTVRQRRERKQEQQNRAHDCKRAHARILENFLPCDQITPR